MTHPEHNKTLRTNAPYHTRRITRHNNTFQSNKNNTLEHVLVDTHINNPDTHNDTFQSQQKHIIKKTKNFQYETILNIIPGNKKEWVKNKKSKL